MERERWLRLQEVVDGALAAPPEERSTLLEESLGDDEELRREAESLLAASGDADEVIRDLYDAVEEGLRGLAPREAPSPSDRAGERIGPYQVERQIGRGGMGEVYVGHRADRAYEGRVAIKVLPRSAGGDDATRRFHQERQILATLDHPHIARLLDAGTTGDGQPYFVMEYVPGTAIDAWCDERRLPVSERIRLFLKVVEAVQAAHRNLVVHRDLKPANVRVTADGTPKLLDFGIAKLLDSRDFPYPAETTLTALRPMTLSHASPEQLSGGPITTATDVYSLGVTLYRLLTGRLPYRGDVPIHHAIVHEEPVPPSAVVTAKAARARGTDSRHLRRLLRGDLDNVLRTALAKDPSRRYGSAEAFAADLERHLRGLPVIARRPTLSYRTAKLVRRNPLAAGLAGVLVTGALGFTVSMGLLADRLAHERDRAQAERDRARQEEIEAQQVADLLVDLFSQPDPVRSRGEAVTAREILDRGAERVTRELGDQPTVQAELFDTMGMAYHGLGLHEAAAPLVERGLVIRQQTLGADHPGTLESLCHVADVHQELGNFQQARDLHQQALDGRSRVFGASAVPVAAAAEELAKTLTVMSAFAEAEAALDRALAIRRAHSGDDVGLAGVLFRLARVQEEQGRMAAAEPLFREAHAIRLRTLGEDHPDTLEAQMRVANMLRVQGRHAEAEAAFRRLLEVEQRVFGEDHFQIPYILTGIGFSVLYQGLPAEAEPYFREALRIREALGETHPAVMVSLNNLAFDLQTQGRHAEAEVLYRRAVKQGRETFPSGSPNVTYPMVGLGEVLTAQEKVAEAEPVLREAVELRRSLLGPESPLTAQAESALGACLLAGGAVGEAEELLRHAWAVQADSPHESEVHRQKTRRRLEALPARDGGQNWK